MTLQEFIARGKEGNRHVRITDVVYFDQGVFELEQNGRYKEGWFPVCSPDEEVPQPP